MRGDFGGATFVDAVEPQVRKLERPRLGRVHSGRRQRGALDIKFHFLAVGSALDLEPRRGSGRATQRREDAHQLLTGNRNPIQREQRITGLEQRVGGGRVRGDVGHAPAVRGIGDHHARIEEDAALFLLEGREFLLQQYATVRIGGLEHSLDCRPLRLLGLEFQALLAHQRHGFEDHRTDVILRRRVRWCGPMRNRRRFICRCGRSPLRGVGRARQQQTGQQNHRAFVHEFPFL